MSDARTTAEEMAAAFFAGLNPATVQLDRIAGMSAIEIRMLGAVR